MIFIDKIEQQNAGKARKANVCVVYASKQIESTLLALARDFFVSNQYRYHRFASM